MSKNLRLYNFADNHDVEKRTYTKLNNKRHFYPYIFFYIPSCAFRQFITGLNSELMAEKEKHSDKSLRFTLSYDKYKNNKGNPCTGIVSALEKLRTELSALSYGDYKELLLANRQFAFIRKTDAQNVIVCVNNDDNSSTFNISAEGANEYIYAFSGKTVNA